MLCLMLALYCQAVFLSQCSPAAGPYPPAATIVCWAAPSWGPLNNSSKHRISRIDSRGRTRLGRRGRRLIRPARDRDAFYTGILYRIRTVPLAWNQHSTGEKRTNINTFWFIGDKYQYILIFYHFPSQVGGIGPDKRLQLACLKMIFYIVVC